MTETEHYREVLELIARDTAMMGEMKFSTPELEQRFMQAHNLKMHLYATNVLRLCAPLVEED